MKKSKTLPEKLKNYSLLAGSMVATSIVAQGQVIYTDINPDVELGGIAPATFPYDSAYLLDLNNDGVVDFRLFVNMIHTIPGGYDFDEKIEWQNNPGNLGLSYTVNYGHFALKLNCGNIIPFPSYTGSANDFFAIQNSLSTQPVWHNVHDRYVGLKFYAGTDVHWGWVRLDVNTTGIIPNIIIKSYAYESTPNNAIAVCDTGIGVGINVELLENKNQFTLFPNPSNGIGTIKFDQSLTGDIEMNVKDALGQEVYKRNLKMDAQQKELPLDLSHLPTGIYFIQLKSKEISFSQKWIKE